MRKSGLAIHLRGPRLLKAAVWGAVAASVAACGDPPVYTRGPDRSTPAQATDGAIGEGTGGITAAGGSGIGATGGEPGGPWGGASGRAGAAVDAGVEASAGGEAGSEGAAGAGGLGADGGDGGTGGSAAGASGAAAGEGGAGGRPRQGGFTGFGGRAPSNGPRGSGGQGGIDGAGGTLGAAGAGGAQETRTPDGQAGAKGTGGNGPGGGGGSRGIAGAGGSTPSTDASKVGFESSSQGWYSAAGGFSNVGRRTTRAYAGVASLGARLQYAGGAPVTNTLAVDSVAPASVPGPGSVITFHVYLPVGARAVEWIQPFFQDTNRTYASGYAARSALRLGAWNTVKVTVPPNAVPTLHVLGVEFRTSGDTPFSDDVFIDAIDW